MVTYWAFRGPHASGWAKEDGASLEISERSGAPQSHSLLAGQTAAQLLRTSYGATNVEKCELEPGTYYPRVWRPNKPAARDVERDSWSASATSAHILFSRLNEILRFVEPAPTNLDAFGHELRMLLILACTEVESGWSGVLTAHGYAGNRWRTTDYVKLLAPMKLDEWAVMLARAPALGPIRPFEGWSAQAASQSLPWYDAYNQVKHFRETRLPLAALKHTIHAVAAAYVMFVAQFGTWEGFGAHDLSLLIFQSTNAREIAAGGNTFRLDAEPTFGPGECYAPPAISGRSSWNVATLSL